MFKHSDGYNLLNPHKVDKLYWKAAGLEHNNIAKLFSFEYHPIKWPWTEKARRDRWHLAEPK